MTTEVLEVLAVSAANRWRLAQATISFQAVLAWDQAWTGAAESEAPLSCDGARLLPILAAELQRGLGKAHQGAAWLHDYVLTTRPERLARALAVQADDARKHGLTDFADLLTEFGEHIGEIVEVGYRGFIEAEAEEQKSLSEKLTTLLQGGSASDLSLKIRCRLADLTIGAGLVSAVVPPHAHAAGIIAAGSAARKVWRCAQLDDAEIAAAR